MIFLVVEGLLDRVVFRSCAHWLDRTCGIALGTARENVRVARALGGGMLLMRRLRRVGRWI
jgi:hypothetical protein